MNRQYDEDLFSESTMTFGEHLEELRRCLIKSLLGLFVGVIIGLTFSSEVVKIIQSPIEGELKNYYRHQAETDFAEFMQRENEAGREVAYTLADITKMTKEEEHIYTQYLVHADAIRIQLGIDKETPPPAGAVSADNESAADAENESSEVAAKPRGVADLVPLFVWRPMTDDERMSMSSLNVQEAFMIWLKASLVAGFVIASPWIFYQLWNFVAAGLYPHEKKYIHVFLPFSLLLFLTGAIFCFFIVFPFILEFLFGFNAKLGIAPDPRISEWVSFAIFLPVGFGISFQLPLVMLFLERIGMFNVHAYLSKWRIAILIIFVLSMLLTPADPMSMMAMALPLTVLYFGGIALCHYFPKRKGVLEE
jgi:sec-independent protein translocase protein TatC